MPRYSFRKITTQDEAMFKQWLTCPHIGGWWQDGDTEWALVRDDLGTPTIDMRVAQVDGSDIGFVQDYNVHDWPMPHYSDLPNNARGLDMFLGDPAYLRRGHASGFIAARLLELNSGTIVVDPDPTNTRAIATYKKAGFRADKITTCEDGDLVQIMRYP